VKVYESTEVRNVALVGHGNSGKTSLAAGMSFAAGVTNRLTRVDEGNTLTDYDDEEISRKITISTALVAIEWKKMKLNVFDTPGFNLFMYDTKMALAAADAALVVVDGVGGVEVQTEKVWEYSEEFKLPRAFFINRLDRERSDFDRSVANIQEFFDRGGKGVPGRGGPDPHEGLHVHARWRRKGQGDCDPRGARRARPGAARATH
jgi:elongation factor G